MTQKETIKKVLHYIRRYRFFLIASLVLALITVVLTLYVPILTGQAVDLIVGKGQVDFAGVYRICVKIGIAILLTMVAQWVMNVANNKITYSVVRDIRTDAFEKIQVLPLSYIDSHSYGGIVSRVIADADQFADGLLMGFTQLFTGVITILGTLGFMLSVRFASAVKEAGGRAVPLAVSGAFHSPYMNEAAHGLRDYVQQLQVQNGWCPVYANRTAQPYTVQSAQELISSQVNHPVQWVKTIEQMVQDGVDCFIEVGPGKTLSGLVKKITAAAQVYKVESLSDLEQLQMIINQ